MAPVALGFETMAAVSGAQGELRVDGELTMSVRGLVLAQAEPVPGNLLGTNPAHTFHAIVSCQSVDDAGAQDASTLRCDCQAVGHTADVDASNDLVRAGVDD
jgi:hypothetical protein